METLIIASLFVAFFLVGLWSLRNLEQKRQVEILKIKNENQEILLQKEQQFELWRQREEATLYKRATEIAENLTWDKMQKWKDNEEDKVRKDAALRSSAVLKGKSLEHLLPFATNFSYHPSDARFLGSPVDLIVFDGLSQGKLEKIIFIEIKTGKSRLTERESQIRDTVMSGNISWEQIRVDADAPINSGGFDVVA